MLLKSSVKAELNSKEVIGMCFSMEEYERLKALVKERKRIKEELKDIKPSDFEKKEEEEKEVAKAEKG